MSIAVCPPAADLERLFLGGLRETDADAVEQHVLECTPCLASLKSLLVAKDTLTGVLTGSTSSDPLSASPLVADLIVKLKSMRPKAVKSSKQGTPMIAISCSACQKKLSVKEEAAGKKVKCPACGQVTPIPALQPVRHDDRTVPPAPLPDSATIPPSQPDPPTQPPVSNPDLTMDNVPHAEVDTSLTDFLAPPQAPDELGRLGKYRILKILGHGGMGVVYQAEDIKLKRSVALKAMLPTLAASASSGKRFLREAEAMAKVEHDHVVRIYQIDEERGVPFMAMEFLKGEPLDVRLQRDEKLPITEMLRIGREIADGLAAAHALGLIHRDIKPANVWLESPRNRVKILDFGLARAASQDAGLTQQGSIIGTPAYMAPEQGRGDTVDARCDLFSLGVVLYRMSTGQQPFIGKDTVSTLMSVAMHEPTEPKELNAELPAAFSELVMKLLEKDPAARIASAELVVQTLQKIEQELGRKKASVEDTLAQPYASSPHATQERAGSNVVAPRRRRFLILAASLFAGLLLVAGISVAFGWHTFLLTQMGIIRISNEKGDFVLNTDDEDFTFSVKKGDVILHDKQTKREYKLKVVGGDKAGDEFKLDVTDVGAGLSFKVENFTIRRGQQVALKAWFERKQPADVVIDGWTQLFNGKDMTGWKNAAWAPTTWRVEGGNLVGKGHGSVIFDKPFKDFHCRIEVKINDKSWGGLCFRGDSNGNVHTPITSLTQTGGIWRQSSKPSQALVKMTKNHWTSPDTWMTVEAIVVGKNVTIHVNGTKTAELHVDEMAEMGDLFVTSGSEGTIVTVRKVEIKELPTEEPGWVQLFNGKDLNGWKTHKDQPGNWKVEDGAIVGRGPPGSHLFTERGDFDNFHLRADVKISEGGDSGITFRHPFAIRAVEPRTPQGFEANITSLQKLKTGSLWVPGTPLAGPTENPIEPNQWFTMEVIARGKHIVIKVNGKTTADFPDSAYSFLKGHVALQVAAWTPAGTMAVHFKKVETKELPASKTDTAPFVLLAKDAKAERKFATLVAAVEAAHDRDTVEIRGDGPFVSDPVVIGEALTIRAGKGFQPVIRMSPRGIAMKETPLLKATAPLVLEGLDLQMVGLLPWDVNDPVRNSLLHVENASIHVANCRFAMNRQQASQAGLYCTAFHNCPMIEVRNCLRLDGSIFFTPVFSPRQARHILENCLLIGGSGIYVQATSHVQDARLELRNNTIAGSSPCNVRLHPNRPPEFACEMEWTSNLIAGRYYFHADQWVEKGAKSLATLEFEKLLRRELNFKEKGNVFALPAGSGFLQLAVNNQNVTGTQPRNTLTAWEQFWDLKDTGNTQAKVIFKNSNALLQKEGLTPDDFRLAKGSPGQGVLPGGKDVGADIDLVGPGAAYERWQTTPEYLTWRKNTGQIALAPPQYALLFDLSGKGPSKVEVPTLKCADETQLTVEAFVTPTSDTQGAGNVIGVPQSLGLSVLTKNWGFGGFGLAGTAKTGIVMASHGSIQKDRRVHLAGVRTGDQLTLFLDGKRVADVNRPKLQFKNGGLEMGGAFHGIIGEVRISKTARYTKDFVPESRFVTDKNTLALYHFDEGKGETLIDSSGNEHHGKIVGAKWVNADGTPIAPVYVPVTIEEKEAKKLQADWAAKLNVPVVEKSKVVGIEMVLIPPGGEALPQPYRLGKYEVTQGEWEAVMGYNPSYFKNVPRFLKYTDTDTSRLPVDSISWYDSVEFCNKLSEKEGLKPYYALEVKKRGTSKQIDEAEVKILGGTGYHIPMDKEWEHGCRAGTKTKYYCGDSDEVLLEHAWFSQNSGYKQGGNRSYPVGKKKPNAFGLYDMHGNMWEWNEETYAKGAPERVFRGGNWNSTAAMAAVSYRNRSSPAPGSSHVGLRLARVPAEATWVKDGSNNVPLQPQFVITGSPRLRKSIDNKSPVRAVAWGADSNVVIAGSDALSFFDTATGDLIHQEKLASAVTAPLSLSLDRKTLALVHKNSAMIFDLPIRKIPLESKFGFVFSVALSPDGKTLVYGGALELMVHDRATGKTTPHTGQIRLLSMKYSPDGRYLVGIANGELHILDGKTFNLIAKKPTGNLGLTDISSDSKRVVVSGLEDGKPAFFVYGLEDQQLIYKQANLSHTPVSLAFSPDGNYLAFGTIQASAQIWDLTAKKEVASWNVGKTGPIPAVFVAFAPDGKTLATGSGNSIALWDLTPEVKKAAVTITTETPKLLTTLKSPSGVSKLAFSAGGSEPHLLVAATDQQLAFFDLDEKKPGTPVLSGLPVVSTMATSADGKTLVYCGIEDKSFITRLWKLPGREIIGGFTTKQIVQSVALSPDGKTVVYDAGEGLIFRDVATGKSSSPYAVVPGLRYAGLKFSPDGEFVAGIYMDMRPLKKQATQFVTFNAKTFAQIAYKDMPDLSEWTDISSDGKWFVVKSKKGGTPVCHLFSLPKGELVNTLTYLTGPPISGAFSPDGAYLATGHNDGTVQILHIESKKKVLAWNTVKPTGPIAPLHVHAVAFSPDGKTLATTRTTGEIHLWDLTLAEKKSTAVITTGVPKLLTTLKNPGGVSKLAFPEWETQPRSLIAGGDQQLTYFDLRMDNPTNRTISGKVLHQEKTLVLSTLSTSADGKSLVYSGMLDNGGVPGKSFATRVLELPGRKKNAEFNPTQIPLSSALSPDGKTLVHDDGDGLIFRDVLTGKSETIKNAFPGQRFMGLKFSPDGRFVTGVFADLKNVAKQRRWLVVFDARTRAQKASVELPNLSEWTDISSDSKWVVVGSVKDTIKPVWSLYSLPEGELVHTQGNLPQVCSSGAFSPDGAHLAVGYFDGKVQVWETRTKKLVLSWAANEKVDPKKFVPVHAVAFSPDGKMLATTSPTGDIHLWDLTKTADPERSAAEWVIQQNGAAVRILVDGKQLVVAKGVTKLPEREPFRVHGVTLLGKLTNESDIACLNHLPELDTIMLHGIAGTDGVLAVLKDVRELNRLSLSSASISDAGLEHVARYPKLTNLNLFKTSITDQSIPALTRLSGLAYLNVKETKISPDGVKKLASALGHCQIEWDGGKIGVDPDWLKFVTALPKDEQMRAVTEKLQERNKGYDGKMTPVYSGNSVTELLLWVDNVTDISPLRALPELRTLLCTGLEKGKLTNLAPLRGMKLTSLNIGSTQVTDLSPLKDMKLNSFTCYSTPVTDLGPLKDMKLTHLNIIGTQVADLSPLKDMKLTSFFCEKSKVTDLSILKEMPLQELKCDFDALCDTAVLRSIKTLQKLNGKPAAEVLK